MKPMNVKPLITLLMAVTPLWTMAQTAVPSQKTAPVQNVDNAPPKIQNLKLNQAILIKRNMPVNKNTAKGLDKALGGMNSGGGDLCERRIEAIRDDINQWLQNGGPEAGNFVLPQGVRLEDLKRKVGEQIRLAQISCLVPTEQNPNPVQINGIPKTCRFDKDDKNPTVTCDVHKLMGSNAQPAPSSDEQYQTVFHEYLGLAGFEQPEGAKSSYVLSNQISAYLENQVVRKLAIKAPEQPAPQVPAGLQSLAKVLIRDGSDNLASYLNDGPYWAKNFTLGSECSKVSSSDVTKIVVSALQDDLIAVLASKSISIVKKSIIFKSFLHKKLMMFDQPTEFAYYDAEMIMETSEGVKLTAHATSWNPFSGTVVNNQFVVGKEYFTGAMVALSSENVFDKLGRMTSPQCRVISEIRHVRVLNADTQAEVLFY